MGIRHLVPNASLQETQRLVNDLVSIVNTQQRKIDEYDKELTLMLEIIQDLSGATIEDIMNNGNEDSDS